MIIKCYYGHITLVRAIWPKKWANEMPLDRCTHGNNGVESARAGRVRADSIGNVLTRSRIEASSAGGRLSGPRLFLILRGSRGESGSINFVRQVSRRRVRKKYRGKGRRNFDGVACGAKRRSALASAAGPHILGCGPAAQRYPLYLPPAHTGRPMRRPRHRSTQPIRPRLTTSCHPNRRGTWPQALSASPKPAPACP